MKNGKNIYKAFSFIQYFAVGIWGPYLPVFLYQNNYSGIQIGLMLGTMPIIMIIFQPGWSYLSDILQNRRTLLLISSIGSGIAALGLGLTDTFVFAMIWSVLFAAMWAPINPVSTAILLEMLEESGEIEKFSLVRLWGSLGFAVASFFMGSFFLSRIVIYFGWIMSASFMILVVITLFLPKIEGRFNLPGGKKQQILSGNRSLVIYLIASIFIGASLGIYNNYQTLFLQFLQAQDWLIGFTVSLQALIEVPLMLAVPFLLKTFSWRKIIFTGAILLPLRWLLFFVINEPGWVAPSQVIHGVAVISFFVVGVAYIDKLINPRWRATGQGLYSTAFSGIGPAIGVYLAGIAFEWFTIRSVWALNLILGLIGLGLLYFAFKQNMPSSSS